MVYISSGFYSRRIIMPTYEYRCTKCNHEFEDMLPVNDRDIPTTKPCPECKAKQKVVREWRNAPAGIMDAGIKFSPKPGNDFNYKMGQIKNRFKKCGDQLKGF
jgi:putative FmdB family regulatory protein